MATPVPGFGASLPARSIHVRQTAAEAVPERCVPPCAASGELGRLLATLKPALRHEGQTSAPFLDNCLLKPILT